MKTLSDGEKVNFEPTRTNVGELIKIPKRPIGTHTKRLRPVEFRTYVLRARLLKTGRERDSDIHLVIAPAGKTTPTMIVEFPSPECLNLLTQVKRRGDMEAAFHAFDTVCGALPKSFHNLQGEARITGVGFLDIVHGKTTGQAKNGIELHPVLKFEYLTPTKPCRPKKVRRS